MKRKENSIEFSFYKYWGAASIKLFLFMVLGLWISFWDVIFPEYWYVSVLMVLVSALMITVFFTSKVTIRKETVFFSSILKKATIDSSTIKSYGFVRQPFGVFQKQIFKEIGANEKVGFFAVRLFYISTEEDFVPYNIKNVSSDFIYFECNFDESVEVIKYLDNRPEPMRNENEVLEQDVNPPTDSENGIDDSHHLQEDLNNNEDPEYSDEKQQIVVTRAHLMKAVKTKNWDLLDLLLELDNSKIDDNSMFTDDWGDWWGMLMECIFRKYVTGIHILIKHGVNTTKGTWGDGIEVSPVEAAKNVPQILVLLNGGVTAQYKRATEPVLPKLTTEELEFIRQGENKDKNGFFFNTNIK